MKKTMAFLAGALFAVTVAACGGGAKKEDTTPPPSMEGSADAGAAMTPAPTGQLENTGNPCGATAQAGAPAGNPCGK